MASVDFLKREEEFFASLFESGKGEEAAKSRGKLIEKKMDILESLAANVSNRRSRRWLNDRLLIELVPRLNVEEIRGLFAPPPWGEEAPPSAFCLTNVREWDQFRNIDMDVESIIINGKKQSESKERKPMDKDKRIALNAWHRVDSRTRAILKRYFLSDILEQYEDCVRDFVTGCKADALVLDVQYAFHRLLLHGVCEFYNLTSVTLDTTKDSKPRKSTTIKKKLGSCEILPTITLVRFLKMAKEGAF
ncbi:hypothetical protein LUZ60_012537 [Juncus effusus]|nr:hypothetical protein LUZ60_012537 [Juncus effusus]